jgi:hypothetical protein
MVAGLPRWIPRAMIAIMLDAMVIYGLVVHGMQT